MASAMTIAARTVFATSRSCARERLSFEANRLVISSIDIQAVEPVDSKTRESLQKSVQLAIGITTQSQEAEARHAAERTEQEARGLLERQKIQDEASAEKARRELLQLQVESAAIESTGTAKAEAQARSEAATIEGTAAVEQARLRAKAMSVESESELTLMRRAQEAEVAHQKALDELELTRTKRLAEIESKKFSETVAAIGTDTLAAIASAGPQLQAKLLTTRPRLVEDLPSASRSPGSQTTTTSRERTLQRRFSSTSRQVNRRCWGLRCKNRTHKTLTGRAAGNCLRRRTRFRE